MASDFKIDDSGNLVIENGDFVIVTGREEIVQRIKSRFRTQYTEWTPDPRLGFPTVGQGGMFDSSTPLIFRLAMARKYIQDTDGVLVITKFDPVVDDETKGLRIGFEANTEEGEIALEITL